MPTTPGGIDYEQIHYFANGQPAYHETFARDNNLFVAHLAVAWEDVQDFRGELLGLTEWTGAANFFKRTLPLKCPYTAGAYAQSMEMIDYGRRAELARTWEFDTTAEGVNILNGVDPGNTLPAVYDDSDFDDWMTTDTAIYKVTFGRVPHDLVTDEDIQGTVGTGAGCELTRYVVRQRATNVRELRIPDFNFKPSGSTDVIRVNGFIPSVETEYTYTWVQVPFDKVPVTAIGKLRLRVNESVWDNYTKVLPNGTYYTTDGHRAETMLFIDASGIDVPYQGADGALYCDVKYHFRKKEHYGQIEGGSVDWVGHNYFLNAKGNWYKPINRQTSGPVYATSADFNTLFVPEP